MTNERFKRTWGKPGEKDTMSPGERYAFYRGAEVMWDAFNKSEDLPTSLAKLGDWLNKTCLKWARREADEDAGVPLPTSAYFPRPKEVD